MTSLPGWLAEAMPDWLTQAVQAKPAPVPWGAMIRAALAICAPLSVGILAGRRDVGLVLAIGELSDDEALKPVTDAVRPVLSMLGPGPQPARDFRPGQVRS